MPVVNMGPATTITPYRFTFTEAERRVFKPRERLTGSQWAVRHRVVIEGDFQGRWSNTVTPYLSEPIDKCTSDTRVRTVIMCFAPQTGKTQVAVNMICYAIDQDPGPAMYVMPDQFVCGRKSKRVWIPTFRATPRTAELLSPRADDISTYEIRFMTMDLMMSWAGSPSALASEAVRYLILDEFDKGGYNQTKDTEVAPVTLARKRTTSYPYTKKELLISTPELEGGNMDKMLTEEADEVRDFHVPCPACGHLQIMTWDNITWPSEISDPRTVERRHLAHYSCASCAMKWDDRTRDAAVRDPRACWIPRTPAPDGSPTVIAYHLPSWYSPFVSISEAVGSYLRGLADPSKMIDFITQHKAEPYKQTLVRAKSSDMMINKVDHLPALICPSDTVALTAYVDPGINRFWYLVAAWTREMNCHVIDYGSFLTWEDVRTLMHENAYAIEGDEENLLQVWRGAVDTGGGREDDSDITMTDAAYDWIRKNGGNKVVGTKGMSQRPTSGRKIVITKLEKNRRGKPIPGGVELWKIDTGALKDAIHYRLSIEEGKPGRLTFHADAHEDIMRHIAAEEKQKDKKTKRATWVKVGKENHWLDCLVGCFALADPEGKGGIRVQRSRPEAANTRPSARRVLSRGVV